MRIVAVHLLNDYSGSPKVLMQLLKGWSKKGLEVHLFTSSTRDGFLSYITKVQYHFFWYKLAENPYLRLVYLLYSQIVLCLKLLFFLKHNDTVYVNTVLPFGATLAAKLRGIKVIYHIHETSMKPQLLKKFLFAWVDFCAYKAIYVSNYLKDKESAARKTNFVLYNAIPQDFYEVAVAHRKNLFDRTNILMICSLKIYKGVHEFLSLSFVLPHYKFRLVVNASQEEIEQFFYNFSIPSNLTIYPVQQNTHPFYSWADLVLNLSHTDKWVETFGLTVIEAMSYGLPVIVPPVGGIAELVANGENGYCVDSQDENTLKNKVIEILENPHVFDHMHQNNLSKIHEFNEDNFIEKSLKLIV